MLEESNIKFSRLKPEFNFCNLLVLVKSRIQHNFEIIRATELTKTHSLYEIINLMIFECNMHKKLLTINSHSLLLTKLIISCYIKYSYFKLLFGCHLQR